MRFFFDVVSPVGIVHDAVEVRCFTLFFYVSIDWTMNGVIIFVYTFKSKTFSIIASKNDINVFKKLVKFGSVPIRGLEKLSLIFL
jgi:hypothetical protein